MATALDMTPLEIVAVHPDHRMARRTAVSEGTRTRPAVYSTTIQSPTAPAYVTAEALLIRCSNFSTSIKMVKFQTKKSSQQLPC